MQLCRPLDILIRNMSIVSKRQTMQSLIIKLIIHELTDTFSNVIWIYQYNKKNPSTSSQSEFHMRGPLKLIDLHTVLSRENGLWNLSDWRVTRLWISLILVNNSSTRSAIWLCTYLYINIAILNVYISYRDSNSKDWNIGAESVRMGTDFIMRTARFCNLEIDITHSLLTEPHISIQYSIYRYMKL